MLTRRQFLAWPFIAIAYSAMADRSARLAASHDVQGVDLDAVFDSYVDALLPDDETPGAIALDVHRKLRLQATMEAGLVSGRALLIRVGCRELERLANERYGRGFAQLPLARRDAIIGVLAEAPRGSALQRFFWRTRYDAFALYYSHPRAWQGLGNIGPPQPLGYMDFASKPDSRDVS